MTFGLSAFVLMTFGLMAFVLITFAVMPLFLTSFGHTTFDQMTSSILELSNNITIMTFDL
jgi:hypothetical protein